MIRIRLASVLGALFLVSACSDGSATAPGAPDAPSMNKSASKEKPFKGRCDTSIMPDVSQVGDPLISQRLTITYVCQLSHMGRTTAVADQLLIPTGPNTVNASNSTVYTAANGDKLYSTWTGTGVSDAFGGVVFSGPEVYAGGTGRFANASGSSFISGSGTFAGAPPFPGQFTLDGTLSY